MLLFFDDVRQRVHNKISCSLSTHWMAHLNSFVSTVLMIGVVSHSHLFYHQCKIKTCILLLLMHLQALVQPSKPAEKKKKQNEVKGGYLDKKIPAGQNSEQSKNTYKS